MCGIAGVVGTSPVPVSRDTLQAMADSLAHRGPDDHGFYQAPGVGLAHRRLSIIDLSEAGRQPIGSARARPGRDAHSPAATRTASGELQLPAGRADKLGLRSCPEAPS